VEFLSGSADRIIGVEGVNRQRWHGQEQELPPNYAQRGTRLSPGP
jgi:hypothetical protein